ncbi:hypothetical protein DPMN_097670 [Dreissena polymorpha]|uniref:Uncharacterized protein n=1 Tax=Dreissena polymorpha TaxID=45954 RepID=A0A9D4LC64_DREPO|nr:hypothetical protein DPMN_097670 [Dreissena polymorpha]
MKTQKPTKASILDGTRDWKTLVEGLFSQTWFKRPYDQILYCGQRQERSSSP